MREVRFKLSNDFVDSLMLGSGLANTTTTTQEARSEIAQMDKILRTKASDIYG